MTTWPRAARTYLRACQYGVKFLFIDCVRDRQRCRRFVGETITFEGQERLRSHLPSAPLDELFPAVRQCAVQLDHPWPVYGNVAAGELVALCLICRAILATRVFEIGTFDGNTALNMAMNLGPDGHVFTLDLPVCERERRAGTEPDWAWREPSKSVRPAPPGLQSEITFLEGDSMTFDFSPYERSMDLVFVDGSHRYENVVSDSRRAIQCLKPSGVVVWHDVAPNKAGVVKALSDLPCEVVRVLGTTLAVTLPRQ